MYFVLEGATRLLLDCSFNHLVQASNPPKAGDLKLSETIEVDVISQKPSGTKGVDFYLKL